MNTCASNHLAPDLYSTTRTLFSDSFDEGIRILHCRAPDTSVIESPTTIPDPDKRDTPVFPEVPPSIALFCFGIRMRIH